MKKPTVLQHLSSASDTFLLVAFFALVSMPIAVSLGTQPIKDNAANSSYQNNISTARVIHTPDVLGVNDTQPIVTTQVINPLTKVNIETLASTDTRKYTVDTSSDKSNYVTSVNLKYLGIYNVLKIKNTNDLDMKLDISLEFLDQKAQTGTISVNGKEYSLTRKDSNRNFPTITLSANSETTVSIVSNLKTLGSFKITAKIS